MTANYNCVALYNVKVRPDPSTANSTNLQLLEDEAFQISEIVSDRLDPTNTAKKWGHIFGGRFDGLFTALEYPSNPLPISSYTLIDNTTPPVEPTDTFPEYFILEAPSGERKRYDRSAF